MTPRQQAFAREYLIDLNATQAAIRAGYSPGTASKIASQLLDKKEVAAAVQAGMDKRAKKLEITAERVLDEIGKLAFSDVRRLFNADGSLKPLHELDDEAAAAIASFEAVELTPGSPAIIKKVKAWDKRGSLELLARHLKLLTDRTEVAATVSVKKASDLSDDELAAVVASNGR